MTRAATPWRDWLAYAVCVRKLSPSAFWRLSLVEWRAIAGAAPRGGDAMRREALAALMTQYPDKEH